MFRKDQGVQASISATGAAREGTQLAAFARIPVLAIAVVKLALDLPFANRYGWHQDELYYLASGNHLQLGYVDYPPITPLLSRAEEQLFGTSLTGQRVAPAVAGAILIVLAALIARELGGGRFAQVFAAFVSLASPLFLGANLLMQTVSFDQLWWGVALYIAARLRRTGNPRLWLWLGLTFGVALETKYTALSLILGFAIATLIGRRRHLATRWPWLGAVIALVVLAPNLAWQIQNAWPSLTYVLNHQAGIAQGQSLTEFAVGVLVLAGPGALPVAAAGAYRLARRPDCRFLGWIILITALVLAVSGAKNYYLGPLFTVMYAAGAVQLETMTRTTLERARGRQHRWLRPAAIALVALDLGLLPLGLPVLPAQQMIALQLWKIRSDYAAMFGWPQITAQVAAIYDSLPAAQRATATILGADYSVAGAVDLYGPALGLPHAVSPHLTYWFWKPPHVGGGTVITIGFDQRFVGSQFVGCHDAATIGTFDGVTTQETGNHIYVCQDPLDNLDSHWRQYRLFA
jgi:4-amino-4-deoxy-L-arabinose transferase-like glycosyltransferase